MYKDATNNQTPKKTLQKQNRLPYQLNILQNINQNSLTFTSRIKKYELYTTKASWQQIQKENKKMKWLPRRMNTIFATQATYVQNSRFQKWTSPEHGQK